MCDKSHTQWKKKKLTQFLKSVCVCVKRKLKCSNTEGVHSHKGLNFEFKIQDLDYFFKIWTTLNVDFSGHVNHNFTLHTTYSTFPNNSKSFLNKEIILNKFFFFCWLLIKSRFSCIKNVAVFLFTCVPKEIIFVFNKKFAKIEIRTFSLWKMWYEIIIL